MAQNAVPGFFAGPLRYFPGNNFADTTKPMFSALGRLIMLNTAFGVSSFSRNDHGALVPFCIASSDDVCDSFPVERDFWQQDNISSTAYTAVKRYPASVPSHYFQHHGSFVAGSSRMQTIKRIGYTTDC